MKEKILFLLMCAISAAQAQSTLPNTSFESWQRSDSDRYDNPTDGVWATPNSPLDFALPGMVPTAPVQKTNDAQDGEWAALLYTSSIFGILAPGTLFTGKFELSLTNPDPLAAIKLGTPFTARPDRFKGYFKYAPVNSDSCLMYALLTKFNAATGNSDTVGIAQQVINTTVSSYTLFDLPFDYSNALDPDTIQVVFTSSANGNNLQGQIGSQMWIDNILLETTTGIDIALMPEFSVRCSPNPAADLLQVVIERPLKNGLFEYYDLSGKCLQTLPFEGQTRLVVPINNMPDGMYIYVLKENGLTLNSGFFNVNK